MLKTNYWYLFLLIAVFQFGTGNVAVRDVFLDMASRIYLLVQSAELLFLEWDNSSPASHVSQTQVTQQGQGE